MTNDRTDFFREQLPLQLAAPHVTVTAMPLADWVAHGIDRALPVIDRVTGWTAIDVGDQLGDPEPGQDPEYEISIVFCPAVMADVTLDMPMSPGWEDRDFLWVDPMADGQAERAADGSWDTAPIRFADNYLQLVAHVLLSEVAEADPGRQRELHDDLVHSAPAQLHELAPALFAEIELAALDSHLQGLAP